MEVDAVVTSANKYAKNSLVMLDEKCLKENPMWIKRAMVRPEDVKRVVFKVKGIIIKGVNVTYTIEKNGVSIESVPEEYLTEGHEEQINSVSKPHQGFVEAKEVVEEKALEPVESKEEVTVEEVLVPEKEEVKVEEIVAPKKKK